MRHPKTCVLILALWLTFATSLPRRTVTNAILAREQERRLGVFRQVFINNYLKFHKAHRRTHPRLVFRLCLSQPGLGDRITGFFHAYISAVLSDRIFIVDWREPFGISDLLFSNSGAKWFYDQLDERLERENGTLHCLFDCRPGNLSDYGEWFTVVQNRSQPFLVKDLVRIAINHSKFEAAAALLEGLGENGHSYDSMPLEGDLLAPIFRTVFRPSPKMQQFMKEYAGELLERKFVSVHARLGTGVGEEGGRFNMKLSWEELARCLGKKAVEMSKRLGGDGTLFLATDTPTFRSVFRRAIGKLGGKEDKVLFGTWGTKHVGSMKAGVDEDFLLYKMAVLECLLLGKGVGMVSTVSRFAFASAFVGGITEREIIVPEEC